MIEDLVKDWVSAVDLSGSRVEMIFVLFPGVTVGALALFFLVRWVCFGCCKSYRRSVFRNSVVDEIQEEKRVRREQEIARRVAAKERDYNRRSY